MKSSKSVIIKIGYPNLHHRCDFFCSNLMNYQWVWERLTKSLFRLSIIWQPLCSQSRYTFTLRSAHKMGLVPATSPCSKSQGLVASCELAIFATKSSRRDQSLVPATRFWSKNGQFTRCNWSLRLVARTSCKFTRCDKSLRLVAGTSPIVCADLYSQSVGFTRSLLRNKSRPHQLSVRFRLLVPRSLKTLLQQLHYSP